MESCGTWNNLHGPYLRANRVPFSLKVQHLSWTCRLLFCLWKWAVRGESLRFVLLPRKSWLPIGQPFLYGCQWKANASLMRMIHIIWWFHNVISLLCDHKMKLWATSPVHMDHFHTSCCVWKWYLLKATSIRCVNMIHSAVTVYALSGPFFLCRYHS